MSKKERACQVTLSFLETFLNNMENKYRKES